MDLDRIEKTIKQSRYFVVIIFGITIFSYIFWFIVIQKNSLSTNAGDWGAFGDFVGGLLNPLVAYSAFYWLTVSVLVQKQELNETKKALIDSSKAQQEQVVGALRDAKIQSLNMKFIQLNIVLESEISYRNMLVEKSATIGSSSSFYNRDDKLLKFNEDIKACNKIIEQYKKEQSTIIQDVELLLK